MDVHCYSKCLNKPTEKKVVVAKKKANVVKKAESRKREMNKRKKLREITKERCAKNVSFIECDDDAKKTELVFEEDEEEFQRKLYDEGFRSSSFLFESDSDENEPSDREYD
jgi:hypothetical protein